MQTRKEYLVTKGLANAGRGRISEAGHKALDAARAKGITFSDDVPKPKAKPREVKVHAPKPVISKKDYDPAAVREWAKKNGHDVSERGRVSHELVALYLESTDEESRPEREQESDIFRDGPPPRYGREGVEFEGKYFAKDGKTQKTFKVNDRTACFNCRVSLRSHTCHDPKVVTGSGYPISVTPIL